MEMTPDNWKKVKTLFEAALEQKPSERATFLAQECPDERLRQEAEKLLDNHQEAGRFLSDPALSFRMPVGRRSGFRAGLDPGRKRRNTRPPGRPSAWSLQAGETSGTRRYGGRVSRSAR